MCDIAAGFRAPAGGVGGVFDVAAGVHVTVLVPYGRANEEVGVGRVGAGLGGLWPLRRGLEPLFTLLHVGPAHRFRCARCTDEAGQNDHNQRMYGRASKNWLGNLGQDAFGGAVEAVLHREKEAEQQAAQHGLEGTPLAEDDRCQSAR